MCVARSSAARVRQQRRQGDPARGGADPPGRTDQVPAERDPRGHVPRRASGTDAGQQKHGWYAAGMGTSRTPQEQKSLALALASKRSGLCLGLDTPDFGVGHELPWPWPRSCCPRTHHWYAAIRRTTRVRRTTATARRRTAPTTPRCVVPPQRNRQFTVPL